MLPVCEGVRYPGNIFKTRTNIIILSAPDNPLSSSAAHLENGGKKFTAPKQKTLEFFFPRHSASTLHARVKLALLITQKWEKGQSFALSFLLAHLSLEAPTKTCLSGSGALVVSHLSFHQ